MASDRDPAVRSSNSVANHDGAERLRRWRLVLGGPDGPAPADDPFESIVLGDDDVSRDAALAQLYNRDGDRRGGLGGSAPRVARWLGDIRTYFPSSVVKVMQGDAMERLGLRQMLLEPEMLDSVQPDVGLVSTLIGLGKAIPKTSRESARRVVRLVVEQLEEQLAAATRQSVIGALNRAARTSRPRHADIDWNRTIAANLKHYQPEYGTVIPERLIGFARRSTQVQRHIVLCIDQSGSMASSIVYSSVFGAVLASIRSIRTRLIVFDTTVADLTEQIDDPVDVLFGVQLGGGTDINGALAYAQSTITDPTDTVLVLISDLYEGGIVDEMLHRVRTLVDSGVVVVALLALSDDGAPAYDAEHAAALAGLGVPAFACTPALFPELMAAAIEKRDLGQWAASNDIDVAAPVVDD